MAKSKVADPTAPPSLVKDILAKRKEHRLTIMAGGVALFAFIAIIPALAATVAITSLVADPDILRTEAESALEAAPEATANFLLDQLDEILMADSAAGIAALIGVAAAIWSASGAMGHFMEGLNLVFDRTETRNFVVKKLTAIGLMLGAVVMLAATVFAMSIVPALVRNVIDSSAVSTLINIARFPVLLLVLVIGMSTLFRLGPVADPNRNNELVPGGRAPIISPGGIAAAVLALLISALVAWVSSNLGGAGEAYGTLASIISVLLWLHYMAQAVLIGAEVDAYFRRKKVFDARVNAGLPAIRAEAAAA